MYLTSRLYVCHVNSTDACVTTLAHVHAWMRCRSHVVPYESGKSTLIQIYTRRLLHMYVTVFSKAHVGQHWRMRMRGCVVALMLSHLRVVWALWSRYIKVVSYKCMSQCTQQTNVGQHWRRRMRGCLVALMLSHMSLVTEPSSRYIAVVSYISISQCSQQTHVGQHWRMRMLRCVVALMLSHMSLVTALWSRCELDVSYISMSQYSQQTHLGQLCLTLTAQTGMSSNGLYAPDAHICYAPSMPCLCDV